MQAQAAAYPFEWQSGASLVPLLRLVAQAAPSGVRIESIEHHGTFSCGCGRLLLRSDSAHPARQLLQALREQCAGAEGDASDRDCATPRREPGLDTTLTLLTPQADPDLLAAALAVLSRRRPPYLCVRTLSSNGLSAIEAAAPLPASDIEALRSELDALRSEQRELSLQPPSLRLPGRRLVVMDMDSTLVRQEGIDELARCQGVYDQVSAVTRRAMRGEMDFDSALRERCAQLQGAPLSIFDRTREKIVLTSGAERFLKTLQACGHCTALISGGFRRLGQPIAERLGFDHFYANYLEVEGGRLTGRVIGDIVNAGRKASLLAQLCQECGLARDAVVAIGDGANDLPMLGLAGLGIAFNAKPKVQKQVRHRINVPRLDAALYLMGLSDTQIDLLLQRPIEV